MYHVETITPATFAPVSTADLKTWLRLNDTSEDTLLPVLVSAAADKWLNDTNGHVLCSATYRLRLDCWPTGGAVYIPRAPVSAVTLVEYLDPSGTWQTLTGWTTDAGSIPARVVLPTSLPSLHPTQRPAVRVTFTAGYASGAVPGAAAVAIRLLASHWYENRESYQEEDLKELPSGWFALTKQYDTGINTDWNR